MAHPPLTNSLSLLPNPKLVPLCASPCRPFFSSQSLILHHHTQSSSLPLFFSKPKPLLRLTHPLIFATVGQAEPERLPQPAAPKLLAPDEEDLLPKSQPQASQLKNRVVFGLGIGITVGGIVLAGGWVFTAAFAATVFFGACEYFELVRSRGITEVMTPPPRYVSRVCSVICALMLLFVM